MKKLISLLMVVMVLVGTLTACGKDAGKKEDAASGTATETKGKEEKVTIRFVGPGTPHEDQDRITAKINEKLEADGLNIIFEPTFIPWDAWDQKINMMLSTGEEFDILHIMENSVPTSNFVGRGALKPIDEYLDQVPGLKEKFPDYAWDALKVKDVTYSVPNQWKNNFDLTGEVGTVALRKDLMDKAGITENPKTAEELLDVMGKLKEQFPADKKVYAWDQDINRTPVWLHRTYDTWPFYVDFTNSLIYVNEAGEVKSWLETEEFKKDANFYRELYKKGYINPDILSLPPDERVKSQQTAEYLAGLSTFGLYDQANYTSQGLDAVITEFFLNPDAPPYAFMPVLNANGISTTSKHPVEALQLLNWFYDNQENQDLLYLGEKGVDFEVEESGRFKYIPDASNPDAPSYYFPQWQIGYAKYIRYPVDQNNEFVDRMTNETPNVQISIVSGFSFDTEPVKAEYANLLAEITTSILPIKMGVVDYDTAFPAALEKMKAAGLDKVVAEYEKQFKEFLQTKNQ